MMQKWSIQLGEFGIHYRPIVSVKGQVLADFFIERPEKESQDDSAKEKEPFPAQWTLFTDGSSCVDGCGAGVILMDPEGVEFTYALRFQFEVTNKEAEYEALIAGLRIAEKNRRPKPQSKCRLKTGSKQSKWDLHRKRNRHDQILRKGKSIVQYLPSVLNKTSPKKQGQKSRCIKQNGIHQLCTSQQAGVGGGIERKIRERKRGARHGRGRMGYLDDPDS
ncbi:reverse transcriptase domain-containing protein [Tanacetum coccineum]